ncbi:hypothetical protein HA052_22705 [Chromobacterium haemolyticum]|uniref:DNA circulation N-terminal domain-containing protein n=1 Tax=Chromobacterium fluminis TaxID=3044269 RepID=A0ABX0L849_9NEIS|nr:DNA circularization N-terminal domain-containing protein [Chromobacterium haemolyticum]NHR08004.1 hypothetical protein [Chromobacterium haemolyticum]
MSELEKMHVASFRGVPFLWREQSGKTGRRMAEFEYPQRDKPYIEDLGRIIRPFSFDAQLMGEDWQAQLNKLLDALEQPGAGELVHPLFGVVNVYPRPSEWHYSIDRQRSVTVGLEFIEAGELAFPAASVNTASKLIEKADGFAGLVPELPRLDLPALDDLRGLAGAAGQVVDQVRSAYSRVDSLIGGVMQSVGDITSFVDAAIHSPGTFMDKLSQQLSQLRAPFMGFAESTRRGGARTVAAATLASSPTTRPVGAEAAVAHVLGLTQAAVLWDAAHVLAQMPVQPGAVVPVTYPSVDQQAARPREGADAPVVDDVDALGGELGEVLWQRGLEASPFEYRALQALRHAQAQHLAAVARQGVKVMRVEPGVVTPALVMAHRLYGDAGRAGEIVERNRVRHPLFMPAQAMRVLSK